jgi:predicted nucleic acid-binding protein
MSEFFQRPVVCNTSPVISLCKAGLGHLLANLFPKVVTSTAVAAQLQAKDVGDLAEIEKVLSTIEILPRRHSIRCWPPFSIPGRLQFYSSPKNSAF